MQEAASSYHNAHRGLTPAARTLRRGRSRFSSRLPDTVRRAKGHGMPCPYRDTMSATTDYRKRILRLLQLFVSAAKPLRPGAHRLNDSLHAFRELRLGRDQAQHQIAIRGKAKKMSGVEIDAALE